MAETNGPDTDKSPTEDRYELIARGAHDGIWDLDLTTGGLYVSERWIEVAGVEEPPTTLEGWTEMIHPDDRELASEAAAAHIARATEHLEVEIRLLGPDDSTRWVLLRGLADSADPPTRIAGSITDTSTSHDTEMALRHQALHDPLTGLPNRTFLMEELNRLLGGQKRNPSGQVALLFLDLAGFKNVNDTFGHDAGDEILRVIGRRLRFATRPDDLPARFGGDEFVVAMAGFGDSETAAQVAERIVSLLRKPITVHDHDHAIVPSAGLVVVDHHRWAPQDLIRHADTAMYRAKRRGSERVDVHVLVDSAAGENTGPRSLDSAAREGRLLLYYQPIVLSDASLAVGHEALLRWRRPGRGIVSAYEDGLEIDPQLDRSLSRWALEHAIEDAANAIARGCDVPSLAVNISRTHLVDSDLAAVIGERLDEHGLEPGWLRLEVAADALDGLDPIALAPVRRLGVRLHVDNFGVGESSLHRLHAVDPVAVKLDRRLVDAVVDDVEALRLVRAICAAAEASSILVVACGVELPATARILRDIGCTLAQGSLFGAPTTADSAFRPDGPPLQSSSVSASLL